MEVEPIRSSGATLTEALTAAQGQLNATPKAAPTTSEEKGSGFFARLLDSIRSEPSWTQHPWQVGVNRHSMDVVATRWAKKQTSTGEANLAPLSVTDGKSVQPRSSTSTMPAPRTESVVLPSPTVKKTVAPEQNATPQTKSAPAHKVGAASEEQSYGYGLEEILPKEMLRESPLLQRTQAEGTPIEVSPDEEPSPKSAPVTESSPEPAEASADKLSWHEPSALSEFQSLLMARVYDEAAFLGTWQRSFDGRA